MKRLSPIFPLLALLCLLPRLALADPLSDTLDKLLDVPALKGGITGAIVARADDGKVLFERNADTRLTPASNRKLFTSAAALGLLGKDYTFRTDLVTAGKVDADGTLHGDVYLKGAGDSLLAPDDLESMAQTVKKTGVKRIEGHVFGDGTCFTDGPYGDGWAWDYLSDYYAPQVAGLEVSRGVLAVHVTPGKRAGEPVTVTVDQPTAYLPIVINAKTIENGGKEACQIYRPWDKNILIVDGTVALGSKADGVVTVADPSRYAATVLKETLQRDGIAVTGIALTGRTPQKTTLLARHQSVPMSQYIAAMNKPSDNLLAESLVRVLGMEKGKAGTYDAGHAVETPFFKQLGLDTDALQLRDGSGLARRDFVTVRNVAKLLTAMRKRPDGKIYYDSLPIAGVDGTLRRRLKGTKAKGNVHGKTGSLGEVSSVSGYLTGTHGDVYVFSLIMNNFPGDARAVQDTILAYLAETL